MDIKKTDGMIVTECDLKYVLNDIKTLIKGTYKDFFIAHLVGENIFLTKMLNFPGKNAKIYL